jgi:hypothetical protein
MPFCAAQSAGAMDSSGTPAIVRGVSDSLWAPSGRTVNAAAAAKRQRRFMRLFSTTGVM